MRNPSRTLQNSIFEPLYSQEEELHLNSIFEPLYSQEEELHFQPTIPSPQSDWLSQSLHPPSFTASPSIIATMKRAPAAIFIRSEDSSSNEASVECARGPESIACDHAILGMHSSSGSSSIILTSTSSCPPSRSHSSSDVVDRDDGSVASKLLASITKSISSPSLLACCKESARETPYQKTLRLRKMKLQHCAEELGSESSDGLLSDGDYNNISADSYSSQSTRESSKAQQKSEDNASSMMISVKSSPNLGCTPSVSKQIKERSFPPPLTHTLPRSTSSDSFSYSLRAYREDGRFVLKEVKVPCRQYLQACRKDGRLTLQRLITDEDFESKYSDEAHKECRDNLQEDDNTASVYQQATAEVDPREKAKAGACDKSIEVESANTTNTVGQLEVCRGKESKKSEHVGMDNIDGRSNGEKVECLNAYKSLPSNHGNCGSSKNGKVPVTSHDGASSKIKSDFKAAKRKTGKAARVRFTNQHLLSTSWNQQTPIHLLPGKSPKLKLALDFDGTKPSHCATNLGLESKSTKGVSIVGVKASQELEIASVSLRKSGAGVGKSACSTIIIEEVHANCLMENILASLGLDGENWSCRKERKLRESDKNSYSSGVMERSMCNGIKSINIGVREIEDGYHKSIRRLSFDVKCERGFRCAAAFKEGDCADVARGCLTSSSSHFDVQIPSSTNFQGKEWLHTLHCKEDFGRHQLAKSFMKIHCVA